MMIAPVDQNDLGIASPQGPCRLDPGKAAANDDDALMLRWRRFRGRRLASWVSHFQGYSHSVTLRMMLASAPRTPGKTRLRFSQREQLL
jgi:hypothetical protein